ncbi:MAG: lipid-A-disaccharide synthase, partial [Coxiellaceae bacterium]|nr:lipid-A-disaccharide synthase [Coxiellaceae bacterium]
MTITNNTHLPLMDKILMIAGEASGDLLGAHLYESLKEKKGAIDCFGMGGKNMRDAGVNILLNSDELAVVGGIEVLKHFSKIRHAFKTIKQAIKQRRPDLVILIDYPGFNLRIAKYAKKKGCKVFYYVSPQIWAWRYRRIHHI